MNEIKFEVTGLRELPNPFFGENKYCDVVDTKMYFVICDINQLPDTFPTKTNPREQNMGTKVAKKIKDSLLDVEFNDFYLCNRGILISAKSVEYELKTKEVTIVFDDVSVHGIVDGGHTYRTIIENRDLTKEKQFVKIEILTGVENMFERLANARNTSAQVQDKSIAELENKFDIIKEGISSEVFVDNVAYKENEDKDIVIDDILSILNMFDINQYSDTSNPVCSYSSKSRCIKNYLEYYKEFGNKKDNPYTKMKPIMGEIFKLYDRLESNIGAYYSYAVADGRYGRTKGVESSTASKKYYSVFTDTVIDYKSPKSFLYPILAAFRALVFEENNEYKFAIDPIVALDSLGPELVRLTVERNRTLGNNPNAVGKDSNHWSQLYDKVLLYKMKNTK